MRRRAPADRDARRAADAWRCGEAGVHGDMISSLRWTAAARCRFARRARRADPAHTADARQMLRNPIHMAREKTAFDAPQTVPRPARRCIGPRVVAIADNAADKHGGQTRRTTRFPSRSRDEAAREIDHAFREAAGTGRAHEASRAADGATPCRHARRSSSAPARYPRSGPAASPEYPISKSVLLNERFPVFTICDEWHWIAD